MCVVRESNIAIKFEHCKNCIIIRTLFIVHQHLIKTCCYLFCNLQKRGPSENHQFQFENSPRSIWLSAWDREKEMPALDSEQRQGPDIMCSPFFKMSQKVPKNCHTNLGQESGERNAHIGLGAKSRSWHNVFPALQTLSKSLRTLNYMYNTIIPLETPVNLYKIY